MADVHGLRRDFTTKHGDVKEFHGDFREIHDGFREKHGDFRGFSGDIMDITLFKHVSLGIPQTRECDLQDNRGIKNKIMGYRIVGI